MAANQNGGGENGERITGGKLRKALSSLLITKESKFALSEECFFSLFVEE